MVQGSSCRPGIDLTGNNMTIHATPTRKLDQTSGSHDDKRFLISKELVKSLNNNSGQRHKSV